MKLRWLNQGVLSLRSVHRYVAIDNPEVACSTAARIEQAVGRLAAFPLSGRDGIVPGTRELVILRLPYTVVYRVTDAEVQVMRVFHTKHRRALNAVPGGE